MPRRVGLVTALGRHPLAERRNDLRQLGLAWLGLTDGTGRVAVLIQDEGPRPATFGFRALGYSVQLILGTSLHVPMRWPVLMPPARKAKGRPPRFPGPRSRPRFARPRVTRKGRECHARRRHIRTFRKARGESP